MAQSRRRGAALERAICEAALAELRASGYAGMTMEAVTERAQTGKAALYRRWPTKRELVLDALRTVLPDPYEITLQDDLRTALLAVLTAFNHLLAGNAGSPGLDAVVELYRTPELREAFIDRVVAPRLSLLERILREAASRGEIASGTDLPLIARTGPALVLYAHFLAGAPLTKDGVTRIVDEILIPLLRPMAEDQSRR